MSISKIADIIQRIESVDYATTNRYKVILLQHIDVINEYLHGDITLIYPWWDGLFVENMVGNEIYELVISWDHTIEYTKYVDGRITEVKTIDND